MISKRLSKKLKKVETIHDLNDLGLDYDLIGMALFDHQEFTKERINPQYGETLVLAYGFEQSTKPFFMTMIRQDDLLAVEPFGDFYEADSFFKHCMLNYLKEYKYILFDHESYDLKADKLIDAFSL